MTGSPENPQNDFQSSKQPGQISELEKLINNLEEIEARLSSANTRLEGKLDRLFGDEPESDEKPSPTPPSRGMVDDINYTINRLHRQTGEYLNLINRLEKLL